MTTLLDVDRDLAALLAELEAIDAAVEAAERAPDDAAPRRHDDAA